MKKVLSMLLVLCMAVSLFAACGGTSSSTPAASTPAPSTSEPASTADGD